MNSMIAVGELPAQSNGVVVSNVVVSSVFGGL